MPPLIGAALATELGLRTVSRESLEVAEELAEVVEVELAEMAVAEVRIRSLAVGQSVGGARGRRLIQGSEERKLGNLT